MHTHYIYIYIHTYIHTYNACVYTHIYTSISGTVWQAIPFDRGSHQSSFVLRHTHTYAYTHIYTSISGTVWQAVPVDRGSHQSFFVPRHIYTGIHVRIHTHIHIYHRHCMASCSNGSSPSSTRLCPQTFHSKVYANLSLPFS